LPASSATLETRKVEIQDMSKLKKPSNPAKLHGAKNERSRRVRIMWVEPTCFFAMFFTAAETHFRVTANGMPSDATVVGNGFDAQRGSFYFHVSSKEFDPVPEGAMLPEHPPIQFTKLFSRD
jgi:hypothetical protein